jgi:Mg2+-importing ATPase
VTGEPLGEVLARLGTSESGLTSAEAARRLADVGPNDAAAPPPSHLVEILKLVANPLAIILLLASAASAFLREVVNAAIISAMVVLSAALSFWQTYRSERAVRRLQARVAPTATVLRDGAWRDIPRSEVVPGDLVRLSAGDLVPADGRLVTSEDLHLQQSALTGESFPAEKAAEPGPLSSTGADSPALVFLGTSVVSGIATAVVVATGRSTAFGDIVTHLAERPEETEFERGTRRYGMLILKTVVFLVLFIAIVGISLHRDPLETLLFAVALAVGLTPEFLPVITTVTLAQGAVRMARLKVIVKHLSAIQNLGSIDVLCSDKTGTLTAGTMSLDATVDARGRPDPRALALARLNSRFETGIKSPLDAAILAAPSAGADDSADYAKTDEIPFDFDRRRLSVVVVGKGRTLLITKGAPEPIIDACTSYEDAGAARPLDDEARGAAGEAVRALHERGFRVLAVAYREVARPSGFTARDERELTLAGFVTFADHVLADAAGSIERLRADGVDVKILTGDNEVVSRHVCGLVGIGGGPVLTGADLAKLDDAALAHQAERTQIFARVSPAQKHRILRALKSRGHVVGFMGDGINDAPSLHGADVGISVAGAADVAREASDIILLEQHLDVVHAGILAGRAAFGNVMKYLLMGTSSNFGNMFSMAAASVLLPFLPMLPTQILLNNFLYDLAQVAIPTDTVDPAFVRRPQRWNVKLIRNFMLAIGPLSSIYDFITFYVLLEVFRFGAPAFHTGWFVESLATQALVLFVIRTAGRPWRNRPSRPLIMLVLTVVAAGVALPYLGLDPLGFTPLPASYFLFLVAVLVTYLALVEVVKHRLMRRLVAPA